MPKKSKLPDGIYIGTWGGYTIDVRYHDIQYELTVEEGVRGVGFKVVVVVKDGIATFEEINN